MPTTRPFVPCGSFPESKRKGNSAKSRATAAAREFSTNGQQWTTCKVDGKHAIVRKS